MLIGNNNYTYSTEIRDNDVLRSSFNQLVRNTFGFDFKEWYRAGHWGEMYIPHVLLDGNQVFSNVSVNLMHFEMYGVQKNYIQLGTVMTDKRYCGKGLNKYIMENIIKEYKDKADGIYLFANDTVLDYYPRFGFVTSKEYEYFMVCADMDNVKPYVIEKAGISQGRQYIKFCNAMENSLLNADCLNRNDGMYMDKNPGFYHFWISAGFGDCIYYIPEKDVYIAASVEGEILHIHQVFGKEHIEIKRFAKSFGNGIKEVVTGYTPACKEEFQAREHKEEDCTLFIMGEDLQCIEKDKMMFPVFSHA